MTSPDPHAGDSPGVRSDVPGVRVTGSGPASTGGTAGPATPPPVPAPTPSPTPPRTPPPASPAPPATGRSKPRRNRGRGIGLGLAAALLVFVTVVLVLFVIFNTQTVDISLVFGDVQAPLVLALVIAAVLGGLIVAMAGLALRARHKDH